VPPYADAIFGSRPRPCYKNDHTYMLFQSIVLSRCSRDKFLVQY